MKSRVFDESMFFLDKLDRRFLEFGWLIPVFMPIVEAIGRAFFNVLLVVYILWGWIFFVRNWREIVSFKFIYPLTFLLIVFGISIINSEDFSRAFHSYQKYFLVSLTLPLTVFALKAYEQNWSRIKNCLAIIGLVLPIILIGKGLFETNLESFVLHRTMYERNLPFLLPFVMLFIIRFSAVKLRLVLSGSYVFLALLIVLLSDGRAALAAFLVSFFLFSLMLSNKKLRFVLPFFGILAFIVIMLGLPSFTRNADYVDMGVDFFDRFTSGRTVLWRQALTHPPQDPLFGVGMGNVRYVEEVITIGTIKVRHLHNFLFDAWYETGLIGLCSLIFLIIYMLIPSLRRWKSCREDLHLEIGAFLCAVTAIFVGGMFSFSYISPQFTNYLFVLLAALYFIGTEEVVSYG